MKKLSLNTFFIVLFTLIFVEILVFSLIVIRNFYKTKELREYSIHYEKFILDWFDAEKNQYNFLTRYKDDQVFFQSEQNKYIKGYQLKSSSSLNKIDSLIMDKNTIKLNLYDEFQLYKENIYNIDNIFLDITHSIFLRGSSNTGLIGSIFSFYSTLKSISIDNDIYQQYIDQMYKIFLEYLHDPSINKYNDFIDKFSEFSLIISRTTFVKDENLIDTTSLITSRNNNDKELVDNLNSFKQTFSKLVNLDRKLFLNEQTNLMKSLAEATFNFNEKIITNHNTINVYSENKRKNIFVSLIVIFSVLIIISLIILIVIPPLIIKKVEDLKDYITPLKYGQIPNLPPAKIYFSDFANIYQIIEGFIQSLKNASEFANQIGIGNFKFDYKPISNQDELGNALILLRDNLQKAKEEELKRKKEDDIRLWINTGIAKFSDILRQTNDLEVLSSLVIKELVNYVNANQGGIFIINDERKDNIILELTASYAYSKERKKRKIFRIGESLVGTCAVEKSSIFMTDIPEDYISITSGLGEATPRCLLLTPLKFEENVLGVVEIASFEILNQYQIEFVERIAESFASTISIARINQQTVKLLETAKIEAEQRSLKEEELRQNLEELRATQEKMNIQQQELNKLLSYISETAIVVELDVNGNFMNVPEKLLTTLNLNLNDVLGHNIAEFDSSSDSKLSSLEFWQILFEGKTQRVQYKYERFQDTTLWFNLSIHPWTDKNNEVIKFIAVFIDITEHVKLKEQFKEAYITLEAKDLEIQEKLKEMENLNAKLNAEKDNLNSTLEKLKLVQKTLEKQNEKNETLLKDVEEINKKAQKQLLNLRKLFETTNEAFMLIFNGKLIHCNQTTLHLFGYDSEEEFIRLNLGQLSPEKQPDGSISLEKSNEMIKKAIDEGFKEYRWVFRKKDGIDFASNVLLTPVIFGDNLYVFCLVKP